MKKLALITALLLATSPVAAQVVMHNNGHLNRHNNGHLNRYNNRHLNRRYLRRGNGRDVLQRTHRPEHEWPWIAQRDRVDDGEPVAGRSAGTAWTRSALARQTRSSPARSSPASSCTRRPLRTIRVDMLSGAIGIGRRNSKPRRAISRSEPGSIRSNADVRSAAGAPPCRARGSHGPRACSVGMNRSPSAMKTLSVIERSSGQ